MHEVVESGENDAALEAFVARFHAATLPRREWTHAAHLEVGAWHVHHLGPERALVRLRDGIRFLNDAHGTPNDATRGYHETITAAYVTLLSDFVALFGADVPLGARVQRLFGTSLAETNLLLAYWSRDSLFSPRARRQWVPPDRAPLVLPADAVAVAH